MITINLPWPNRVLSPNARSHWAPVSRAKRNARDEAALIVRAELGPDAKTIGAGLVVDGKMKMKITFYPPDRLRRDDDNMIAGFKAARDGLADGLGVDDRCFKPEYHFADAEKPGRVEVSIL